MEAEKSMIKKLRRKFVKTAMLSLLVIIIIMIAFINLVNVHRLVSDADNLLVMLTDNDGEFPDMRIIIEGQGQSGGFPGDPEEDRKNPGGIGKGPKNPSSNDPNALFTLEKLNDNRSREMPYRTRYFYVKFDESGEITTTNTQHIAVIDEETAQSYAQAVYENKDNKGFYHTYRYQQLIAPDGKSIIVFTDLSTALVDAYTLLFQSLLIGLFALIAMFILVYLFSGKAVAPVVESLEKQKRFITDAGHELKTPLAVISANVDVLELEAGKSEWTGSIRNQIKRMNSLVKNMLTLSRMDEDVMHVVYSDFDMSSAVKETAESFAPIAEAGEKNFRMDIEEEIHITGDKNAINQLTSLLLDNAMKYSSEKGSVHILLSRAKNIVLEVSNTCDSIPSGNLDKLFDRFYRADSSRSRESGGFGIGLSVARAIAISHGGTIEALKDGDRIIRFVVTLPKQLPKNLLARNAK
ncbi:HAMP domain-containing histidine kinase [Butyrivibrio sp. DSM 10294]|uniref:sensor histidine kinase n=1 Tax=Butyrivibrio sp. DSM 10294 TaxID=2972457 RepID=UPI00234F559B|nr:HAMP domain-containing sensor histidine kinase [Butyrivibrio sp. DSM 10294]MDC7292142.1 HAMP domain-containing histidine kinase [Butyrivibrio sp. DSM 10294]